MNYYAIKAIYITEMARMGRTITQSLIAPVISTSLYFIVFGTAIGSRIKEIDGINYGSFLVPGLIMLILLTQSVSNAAFGIYFKKFTGTIYELLAAPVSGMEAIIGFVGAAVTKSILLGTLILITANFFVPVTIAHPFWMISFFLLTTITFSLLGFLIGLWAENFEQLNLVPMLFITPLVFLGGSFYSIDMLPSFWQKVSLFNPVLYLVSGFRWSFYEISDIGVGWSLLAILSFLFICASLIMIAFKTGYKIKQ